MSLTTIILSTAMFTGCAIQAKTGDQDNYPLIYQRATEQAKISNQSDSTETSSKQIALNNKFTNFRGLFTEFKDTDLRPRVESVYAEELYFNDTLHTFGSREVMLQYMQETSDRVDFTNIDIKDIAQSGNDYYVRWAMDTGFTVFGKQITTHSIGMTHIRFDESGLINFHQDFWDNTEGLFRHLPVVGFFINRTKQRL